MIPKIFKSILVLAFLVLGLAIVGVLFELPRGYRVLVVKSGSMEPNIGVGSIILTKPSADIISPIPSTEFKIGDVITYTIGSKKSNLVSHRVTDLEEKQGTFYYKTKGDANKETDKILVSEDTVVGKVV